MINLKSNLKKSKNTIFDILHIFYKIKPNLKKKTLNFLNQKFYLIFKGYKICNIFF